MACQEAKLPHNFISLSRNQKRLYMRHIVGLLTLLLFFLLSSCEKTSIHSSFFPEVEALMPNRPDSALALLEKRESIETFSRKDKARYYLLLTEAWDKNYVEHTTDSLITIATEYYEETDDVERKAKAWYYRGRINEDIQQPLKAQAYYLNALRDKEMIKDNALLGRVYNRIGMLYTYQRVYEKAIPYLQQAYTSFQSIKDTIGQTYVLGDLGRTYMVLGQLDSARIAYERALPYAKEAELTTFPSELGSLYLEEGLYEKAYNAILTALAWTEETRRDPVYLVLGKYYLRVNSLDSAEYYLRKAQKSSSLYTQASAFHYLSLVKKARKDWKTSISYDDTYDVLRDSIDKMTMSESIRHVESLYSYQELNQALSQQELTLMRISKERYLYAFVICVVLLVCMGLYMRWKKIKIVSLRREEELKGSMEAQHQRGKVQKEENERQIALLEEEIARIKNEKKQELRIVSLELEKQRLEICNESIANAESKRLLSMAILQKSPVCEKFREKNGLKIQSEDWDLLENLLNETYPGFTHRLKTLCPAISDVELKACMLTKIDLPASHISKLLNYNSSVLRPRIYKKIFGKEGSVQEFVNFIVVF